MDKEKIKKLMESAYNLISTFPVSGDNAERMAIARQSLREAFKLIDEEETDG